MVGNGQERTKKNPKGAGKTPYMRKHPAWQRLSENILGIGAEKFWLELDKLEGKDYIIAWLSVLRYFKPSLAATIVKDITDIPTIELVDGLKQIAEQNGNSTSRNNENLQGELLGQRENLFE